VIWDFHRRGEILREIGRVLGQTIMCSVNHPAQAATGAGGRFANCTPQPHPHVVHLVRVWLWRNYIPGQGVTVMPGAELNLSAPVIFAVPAPAAGQVHRSGVVGGDGMCCVAVGHGAGSAGGDVDDAATSDYVSSTVGDFDTSHR
jgi:hypothetical protein